MSATRPLHVSRVIHADPETLFQAWTDPRELRHWWRQAGDGWAFAGASIDLRVGGRYRFGMIDPNGQSHFAGGVYREVERPVRLVFTWDWETPALRLGDTLVTVEFHARGAEQTEVMVTHEGFADSVRLGRHIQGWTELLTLLEHFTTSIPREGEER